MVIFHSYVLHVIITGGQPATLLNHNFRRYPRFCSNPLPIISLCLIVGYIKVISHNILMTYPDISIKCHFVEENMWVNGKHWFFSTKKARIIFQYHPQHTPVWRKPSPRYVGVAIFEPLWSLLFQKTEGCVGVECYDLYTRTGGWPGWPGRVTPG